MSFLTLNILNSLECIEKLQVKHTELFSSWFFRFLCKLITWCPITSEYFSVYFLQRTCSYIASNTTIKIRKLALTPVQFSSVAQSCPTLSDPMNCSTPGLPVHHHPGDHSDSCPSSPWCHPAISSSVVPFSYCPQPLPASESFPRSQSSHDVAKVLEFQLQHHSLQRNPRANLQNGLVGSPYSPRDSQESSPTPQFKSINSSALSFFPSPTHIHTWPLEKP